MRESLPVVMTVLEETRKRAVIYCRTSGDDRERDSMDNQEKECLRYAESKCYEVVEILREDVRGVSGADFGAPELQKAIELAEKRVYDILLVRDVKRFSRDLIKAKIAELQLERCNVNVEFVWQQFSNDTEGEFLKQLHYLLAQKERRDIAEQMLKGRRNQCQFRNSAMFHNNPPLGYTSERVDKKFIAVIVDKEAAIVRQIFKLYVDDNLSLSAVARRLNDEGVPTYSQLRGGSLFGRDQPSQWIATTIQGILKNTAYIGKWYYGKRTRKNVTKIENGRLITAKENVYHTDENLIEISIPSIIDEALWKETQQKLEENKKFSGRKSTLKFLLGKRVWCQCNWKAISETRRWKDRQYAYYLCHNKACQNFNKHLKAGLIDELAWEWLKAIVEDKEKLKKKVDDFVSEIEKSLEPIEKRLAYLYDMRQEKETAYTKILNNWIQLDEFDKKMLSPQKQLLKAELEDITCQTAELEKSKAELEYIKAEFASGWDTTTAYIWEDQQNTMADCFLNELYEDFEGKVDFVRKYDVKGTITQENGAFWLHLTCKFDQTLLKLCDSNQYPIARRQISRKPSGQ
jgi:site-specific DNA recombinase